ncbi:hypothetical protein [Pseudophaeobacter leonis]|uniref:hypothetical protein n=1 Tax=Pseudophaeobacter leonis TaxID=1144477 RepID=UPI00111C3FCD|nr:hypothetical protein [Pseudophaeobacter leonis]
MCSPSLEDRFKSPTTAAKDVSETGNQQEGLTCGYDVVRTAQSDGIDNLVGTLSHQDALGRSGEELRQIIDTFMVN